VKKILLTLVLALAAPATSSAQSRVSVNAEPVAIGLDYGNRSAGWGLAVEALGGPQYGVDLHGTAESSARRWASTFASLRYRSAGGFGVILSPLGASLMIGNDYSAVYPSAQLGVDYGKGRLGVGTFARVFRIPTADSNAEYWAQWVPVRISYSLTK
jgi:hypothetical protein